MRQTVLLHCPLHSTLLLDNNHTFCFPDRELSTLFQELKSFCECIRNLAYRSCRFHSNGYCPRIFSKFVQWNLDFVLRKLKVIVPCDDFRTGYFYYEKNIFLQLNFYLVGIDDIITVRYLVFLLCFEIESSFWHFLALLLESRPFYI